jgi:hypothetical protein
MNRNLKIISFICLFFGMSEPSLAETEEEKLNRLVNEKVDTIIAERKRIEAERVALEHLEEERAAKRQCERKVNAGTKVAAGTAVGMTGGAVTGAVACTGFLGAIFFDFGLSYATCVAATTAVGSAAGAVVSNNAANEELLKCN